MTTGSSIFKRDLKLLYSVNVLIQLWVVIALSLSLSESLLTDLYVYEQCCYMYLVSIE